MYNLQSPVGEFVGDGHPKPISAGDSVAHAAEVLRHNNSGCVLVEESGKLSGIFTERDFMRRVASVGLPLDTTAVREVMTPDPEALLPIDEVAWAINKMAVGGYRNVPIVTSDGCPVGVVCAFDVIDFLDAALEDALAEGFSGDDESGDQDWHDVGGG